MERSLKCGYCSDYGYSRIGFAGNGSRNSYLCRGGAPHMRAESGVRLHRPF